MTQRERLIKLLDQNCGYVEEQRAELLAEYLISNGVIVPPCKMGDYIRIKGDVDFLLWRVDAMGFYREGKPSVSVTHKNITNTICFDAVGGVILTREEAEKAFSERIEG